MFVRPCWQPRTEEELYDLMDRHPWALLINNGPEGPYATNLPVLLDRSRGEHGVLVAHIARANAHAKVLQESHSPSLVVFEGPASYVTGSWYPNRDMPSTYYYTAIHCYGQVQLQNKAQLEHWLGVLTRRMESEYPDGWKMTDVEHSAITRRLNHILGFEIPIERIEGKFKLGQDEPKKDAMAVAAKLTGASQPSHQVLADMIRHYNQNRSDK
jgi:transcriptional regulator